MKIVLASCMAVALLVTGAQTFADETKTTTSTTSTTTTKETRQSQLMKDCIAKHQAGNSTTTVSEREQACSAEVAAKLNVEYPPR